MSEPIKLAIIKELAWGPGSCGDCDPCIGGRPDQCAVTPIRSKALDKLCDLVRDLLAVIHRDGGQHTGRHGLERSASDAREAVAAALVERDELRAQVGALYKSLSECKHAWADYLHNKENIGWAVEELVRDAEEAPSTPPPPVVDLDKAQQIAEALRMARRNLHWVVLDDNSVLDPIDDALALARKLGVLEDK